MSINAMEGVNENERFVVKNGINVDKKNGTKNPFLK
jgi:hypothetical protein